MEQEKMENIKISGRNKKTHCILLLNLLGYSARSFPNLVVVRGSTPG
jgi:hypothetical protein